MERKKLTPIPEKLTRLRQVMSGLRVAMDEAKSRFREVQGRLRKAERDLAALRREPSSWLNGDDSELGRAIKARDAEVSELSGMKDDIERELEELRADNQPTVRTVRALERYLGISEDDQFMPTENRMHALGDRFDVAPSQMHTEGQE